EEVIDVGGGPHVVMELAPGGSVGDLLNERSGPLAVGEVILIGEQTASALAASHCAGILHLDIKPQNLLIGSFGQVKVCDFGIAALLDNVQFRDRTSSISWRYASPEQLDDGDVGPPADVYALGATLVHAITGRPLSRRTAGESSPGTPFAWDRPSWLSPAIGDHIEDVVARCISLAPERRPTATEVQDELERISASLGPARCRALPPAAVSETATVVRQQAAAPTVMRSPVPPTGGLATATASEAITPPSRRRGVWLTAIAAVAALAVGLTAVALTRGGDAPSQAGSGDTERDDRQDEENSRAETEGSDATSSNATDETDGASASATSLSGVSAATTTTTSGSTTSTTTPLTTVAPTTAATAPPTTTPLSAAPAPTVTRTPNPVPELVAASASVVRPDSEDACGNPTTYPPSFLVDGQNDTAWMAPGDGSGQTLTNQLAGPSVVTEVGLVPGYDKFDPCTGTDRFYELRRVTRVQWSFDDGSQIIQDVNPEPGLAAIRLNRGVVTATVTMTVLSTTPPGNAGLDHTPVSEVVVR
ncbi:MAG: protein kinase domain-containing protein, partial [Ilumatobacteraceae bacterium]